MQFPKSREELKKIIKANHQEIEDLCQSIDYYEAQVEKWREVEKGALELIRVLEKLPTSWSLEGSEQIDELFFFLSSDLSHRVVVREFLPHKVKVCSTAREWQEYLDKEREKQSVLAVPPWYPVVSITEVAMTNCPQCGLSQPVIDHQVKSRNGEAWLVERLVYCTNCKTKTLLQRQKI